MVSALYILHWPESDSELVHSELLLQRRYQNDIPQDSWVLSHFDNIYKGLLPHERTPFLLYHGLNYVYIRGDHDIILLVVASKNINAMSIVVFLKRFYEVLYNYLCTSTKVSLDNEKEKMTHSKLDKDKILDNVNLIFELLDECLDFGIIQITDYNILKEFIKVEANLPKLSVHHWDDSDDSEDESLNANKSKSKSTKMTKTPTSTNKDIKSTHNQAIRTDVIEQQDSTHVNSAILRTYASGINWRPKGIFYPKNEVYIDIIEHCEFMYDLETNIIRRNDIYGTCEVKSYLSGMPVCKLGFNERNMSRIHDENHDEHNEDEIVPENQLKPERNDVDEDDDEEEDNEEEQEITIEVETEQDTTKSKIGKEKRFHIPIRDIQFHQCIELATVYRDSLVTFIPPDDKFTLMTYHVEQQKQKRKLPLIMIKPTFRILQGSNKLQILCVLNTNFKRRLHCKNITVRIPIDPHIFNINTDFKTESLKFKAELGEVSYKIDASELCWTIDDVNGKKSVRMMAELGLIDSASITMQVIERYIEKRHTIHTNGENNINDKSRDNNDNDSGVEEEEVDETIEELDKFYGVHGQSSTVSDEIKRVTKLRYDYNEIQVDFNIPMLSYSGLKLTYLSILEDQLHYTCFPWVRYLTKSRKRNLNNAAAIATENGKSSDINNSNHNEDYRFKLGKSCFQLMPS